MPSNSALSPTPSRRQRVDSSAILRELDELRNSMSVGEAFPSRRELMERFEVSEHIVRGALDEFERQGKIIRRLGRAGSVVAALSPALNGHRPMESTEKAETESQSRTIVTIAEPDGSIFDRALQLLARHPKAAQFTTSFRLMSGNEAESFELPASNQKPLGYLLFRNTFEPLARRLQEAGNRVVLIGAPSSLNGAGVPNVYGDHEEGGALLAHHLLQLGHRRLVAFGTASFIESQRRLGIQRSIDEAGFEAMIDQVSVQEYEGWKQNPAMARDFFLRPQGPTAVFCWNDDYAIRLLTLLNSVGLRVPQDVSLVGYDNLPQSAHTHPALTTVDSAIEKQLNIALRLLTQVQMPSPNHNVVVLPTLVERESSARL